MRIAILGTGRVAQTLGAGLLGAGHDVVLGSAPTAGNRTGLPAPVLASADAVVGADVVVDALQGVDTIPLLESIGADILDGTVLWDIANAANPDFSLAIPDDSLGRRIQAAFPGVKVVKAANNVAAVVIADPSTLPAPTTLFLSGDDPGAKDVVSGLLIDLGWPPRACSTWAASPTPTGRSTTWRCSGRCCRSSARPTSTSPSSRPHSGTSSRARRSARRTCHILGAGGVFMSMTSTRGDACAGCLRQPTARSRHGKHDPFALHRSLLFTVAYEMLGSAADAEDVVQETWLRWATSTTPWCATRGPTWSASSPVRR